MSLSAHLFLAVTALFCFTSMFALPMEGFTRDHNCRCLKTTNSLFSEQSLKRIEILPPTSHCNNFEIILTLKNKKNTQVCVAPDADWVIKLISNLKRNNGRKK